MTHRCAGLHLLPIVATVLACSDGTGPGGEGTVRVMLSTRAGISAVGPQLGISVVSGGATLEITTVELVARQVRLRQTAGSCESASEASPDCPTIRVDPLLLGLPLDTEAEPLIEATLPAGSYDRIQFQFHKPTSSSNDAAFLQAHPEFSGISVRVTGTFNGTAFTYTTDLTVVQELVLAEPVTVAEDGIANITIHTDVRTWFASVTGGLVDPGQLTGSQQLRSRVEQNIRASFRAFEDPDVDGDPS